MWKSGPVRAGLGARCEWGFLAPEVEERRFSAAKGENKTPRALAPEGCFLRDHRVIRSTMLLAQQP
jgi:hypothetical protein